MKLNIKKYLLFALVSLFLIFICVNDLFVVKHGYVTVKGSSEKIVQADMGYWTLSFSNAGNDLKSLKNKNTADLNNVLLFLKENKILDNEIKIIPLELIDMNSREYKDPNQLNRYILTQGVSVITSNVDLLEKISQKLDELIDKNISIKSGYGESRPIYKFTKLNDIKQEMLREATQNAKKSAEQFALDSETKVGTIKYANQGIFTIEPRNKGINYEESFEKEKSVRVVVTIDYWLK